MTHEQNAELTLLFAKIAREVRRPSTVFLNLEEDDNTGISMSIASLTKSLNSVDQSSSDTRVLNAALSLMCLKTTDVSRTRIKRLVETIISVLHSSVSCKISRSGRDAPEFLQIGGSISFGDCGELLRVGADLLESLETNDGLALDLLHAVLKAELFSSTYEVPFNWPSLHGRESEITNINRRSAISRIMCILRDKIYATCAEISLRLFFWHLDPLILKNDISEVLQETMRRPFLSLKNELYNRPTWRRMILCLATSPFMFMEACTLLHSWFLRTGLTFVLELQIAFIWAVLDIISRPMAWGVSMEMGLKYPFAHAYFPNKFQELLGVLNGCISCNNFVNMVCQIKSAVTCVEAPSDPNMCHSSHGIFGCERMPGSIENSSTWSMIMKFPTWFYFASGLIFYYEEIKDSYISEAISIERSFDSSKNKDLNEAAIFYLSFVLSPVNRIHGDRITAHFIELSRQWRSISGEFLSRAKCSSLVAHNKVSLSLSKKLRITKDYDSKLIQPSLKCNSAVLASWLQEFDATVKLWINPFLRNTNPFFIGQENSSTRQHIKLLIKIPLGVLILYPRVLNDEGCELLLYYAATGEILQSRENQVMTNDYRENEIILCYGSAGMNWAFDGACLVFSIFDIIEELSVSLFDSEASRLDFICHLKGKVCKFLLRCVEMLQLCAHQLVEVGGRIGLLDLFRRLKQWKQQGREVFEGCEKFDRVVNVFSNKLLKPNELEEATI